MPNQCCHKTRGQVRFNGAASVKRRKYHGIALWDGHVQKLQWGRLCEEAEMRESQGDRPLYELLQWGRLCEEAEIFQPIHRVAFRKQASMGPPL